jgi:YVTN family beta-propeller protein
MRQTRFAAAMSTRSVLLAVCTLVLAGGAAEAVDRGYAGMSASDSLMAFDLATGTAVPPAIDLLPEGNYPYDAVIHPAGGELWVVGASGDGVVVLDTATDTVIARIDLAGIGEYAVDVVFGRGGHLAYVSSRDMEALVEIDVATHTPTGNVISIPSSYLGAGKACLNPTTGEIIVVDWYGDEFYVVDPLTLDVATHPLGDSLWDLRIDSTASRLYIADRGLDQVHVLNVADLSLVTSIPVGDDPWGLELTPNDALLFVANEDSGDVSVIDTATNTVTATIALPAGASADPRDVDISEDGKSVYLPSGDISGDDVVYVIEVASLTVVDEISMAGASNPNVVAVAPLRGWMLFEDGFESGDLSAWSAAGP